MIELKCWGSGNYGILGTGDTADIGKTHGQMGDNLTAVDLGTGFDVAAVRCGTSFSCAISLNHGMATMFPHETFCILFTISFLV